jgi:transcriptional regulator with XRE-family HTH domain
VDPKSHVPKGTLLPAGAARQSKIRRRRQQSGYTLDDLAYLSRVSKTLIGRMENGDPRGRNPGIQALLAVAVALKCDSVEEVIEDWMWPPPPREPHPDMRHRLGMDI